MWSNLVLNDALLLDCLVLSNDWRFNLPHLVAYFMIREDTAVTQTRCVVGATPSDCETAWSESLLCEIVQCNWSRRLCCSAQWAFHWSTRRIWMITRLLTWGCVTFQCTSSFTAFVLPVDWFVASQIKWAPHATSHLAPHSTEKQAFRNTLRQQSLRYRNEGE